MGFLDRLLGREPQQPRPTGGYEPPTIPDQGGGLRSVDDAVASENERAIARYRYLLRTAPPDRVEDVHAEAFAQLSPEQRQQVLGRLSEDLPAGEAPRTDDPRDLARAATRAEMRQPGYMQSAFAGPGVGAMMGSSMLGTIAGVVVGSAVAQSLFGGYGMSPEASDVGEAGVGTGGGDGGDSGGDAGAGEDLGAAETGADTGGDWGGDFGDFGGFDF